MTKSFSIFTAWAMFVSVACGGATGSAPDGLESVVVERRDLASSVAATGTVEPIRVIDGPPRPDRRPALRVGEPKETC